MRLKAISSLAVLFACILLLGSQGVKAETSAESLKGLFNKEVTSVGKSTFTFSQKQKLREFGERKQSLAGFGKKAAASDYTSIYEVEPNDSIYEANSLRLDEVAFGKLGQNDIDTFKITVTNSGQLVLLGLMDEYASSELGFLLFDTYDTMIDPADIYQEGKQLFELYNVTPGTYYIKAFNMNDYYNDPYALMATMDFTEGDVTPPSAPQVDHVDDNDTVLTGAAEAGSTIEVTVNGSVVGTALTETNGRFTVYLPANPEGTLLLVTATDSAGNRSQMTYTTVTSSTFTGWMEENNKWYHYNNGAINTGWFYENGNYYFLDKTNGAMKTGWLLDGGKWYYLDHSGVMKRGWVKDGTAWYYLNSNGSMKTGWLQDGRDWYYLGSNGAMRTGWVQDGRNWYYLTSNGTMKTGWLQLGTKWYYLYDSGVMAYSTKIGSYRLGSDGAWIR